MKVILTTINKQMDQLYINNHLPEIIRYVYDFLEPVYVCDLNKNEDITSFACTSRFFNNVRHQQKPEQYKDKCIIVHKLKKICKTHCKAYPIFTKIHNISEQTLSNQWDFMHFQSKEIADFVPHLLPHIYCNGRCCGGKGWAIMKLQYKSQNSPRKLALSHIGGVI